MAQFIPIADVAEEACFASGDLLQHDKMRHLRNSKAVWRDLNLDSVKFAKRELIGVNPRTNTIDLPKDCLWLSGVSVPDRFGIFHPVYRNTNLSDDIVDAGTVQNCECGCKNELCNLIKGFESISEDIDAKLPNGDTQTFTCVTRKSFDSNGFYYEEKQYPIRIYTDGVWTSTEVTTERNELCKLQVDDKGCVVDCEENFTLVNTCCGFSNCCTTVNGMSVGGNAQQSCDGSNTWIYFCGSPLDTYSAECGSFFSRCCCSQFLNIYNITELGDRLIFPSIFGHKKVLIRYFTDGSLQDLKIPILAHDTFITGLMWWYNRWRKDVESQTISALFGRQYADQKFGLLKELNKNRIAELKMITTPPIRIPSYVSSWYSWNSQF